MSAVNALANRVTKGTGLLPPDPVTAAAVVARYPAATVLTSSPDRPVYWRPGPLLNQGREGACTGFATTAELLAAPVTDPAAGVRLGNAYGRNHYRRSRAVMGWDPHVDTGSTNDANARVARDRGLIEEYRWIESMDELRAALILEGPVVLGAPWGRGCWSTDSQGWMRPALPFPSGTAWHAVTVTAYHPEKERTIGPRHRRRTVRVPAYRIRNSWGRGWGARIRNARRKGLPQGSRTGDGWITAHALGKLLTAAGNYPNEPGRLDVQAACVYLGRKPVDLARLLEAHPDPYAS